MNTTKAISILAAVSLWLTCMNSCKGKPEQAKDIASETTNSDANIKTSLFDKPLPAIKQIVDGKWELISGQNAGQLCEFENTFITFDGDKYIWTEDGNDEPGDLNWRKAPTGMGYDAFLMDVFYATNPSFPLAVNGDTLFIQDCTATGYKYILVRR